MEKEKRISRPQFLLSPFPFLLFVLVVSCRAAPPPEEGAATPAASAAAVTLENRDQADRWIGRRITLAGRLGTWKGVHATLTTPDGLVIGMPAFELAARGRPWFEHLHRTVEVTGILRPPHPPNPDGIPNFNGHTLDVEYFRGLDR